MCAVHSLENDAEKIEDHLLREYLYEQLDAISAERRSLAEEIRWDIEAKKRQKDFEQLLLNPITSSIIPEEKPEEAVYADITAINGPHDICGT